MKKRYIFLLIFSIVVSGCNFGVEVLTPESILSTPIATPISASPVSTVTVPAPMGDLGFGKIHGKITDAVSGAPIAGAIISCEHHSYTSPATCSGAATTDVDGMYIFEKVFFHDTDTIKLTIEATGYHTEEIKKNFFTMADMEANLALNRKP